MSISKKFFHSMSENFKKVIDTEENKFYNSEKVNILH